MKKLLSTLLIAALTIGAATIAADYMNRRETLNSQTKPETIQLIDPIHTCEAVLLITRDYKPQACPNIQEDDTRLNNVYEYLFDY